MLQNIEMVQVGVKKNSTKKSHQKKTISHSFHYLTSHSEIEGDISILRVFPLQYDPVKSALNIIFGVCLALIPLIMARWSIQWRRKLFYRQLDQKHYSKCTNFLLEYSDETFEIVSCDQYKSTKDTHFPLSDTTGFKARKLSYTFEPNQQIFQPLEATLFKENNVKDLLSSYNIPIERGVGANLQLEGLQQDDVQCRLQTFGLCMIDIDIPHILVYMAEEMTAPLYFVQYIAVLVWFIQLFLQSAILMLCFTTILTIINYFYLRSSMMKLREKAIITSKVQVYRSQLSQDLISISPEKKRLLTEKNASQSQIQPELEEQVMSLRNSIIEVDSNQLVPGDLIILKENMTIPCDCILVAGEIFVNEVTLTGESIPVPKVEIDAGADENAMYVEDQKANVKSLLFEGTNIIKIRPTNRRVLNQCLAVVQRTGFQTFKGQIFRSLVFVKNKPALFQKTSGKFIAILALLGFIVAMILLFQFLRLNVTASTIVLMISNMIIFVAPPAVPIMTTFCLTMSLARLRVNDIFGINPQGLLAAGKVSTCCFDKTGTLTDLHLEFNNYVLSQGNKFDAPVEISSLKNNPISTTNQLTENKQDIAFYLYGSCHSIIYGNDGEMLGDPLDIRMFKTSGFNLSNEGSSKVKYGSLELNILRTFPFSSDDQCMSVVVKNEQTNQCLSLVKGSPEKLRRLSLHETVPPEFEQILNKYTMQGLRVLGMGYKQLDLKQVQLQTRQEVESDLIFLGFIVFVNKLKHDTAEVLGRLKSKEYKVKMISGDNSLTCAQIAKNANIVVQDAQFIILEQEKKQIFIREIKEQELITLDQLDVSNPLISISQWIRINQYLNDSDKEYVMNGQVLETLINLNSPYDEKPLLQLIQRTALFGRCRPEHKAMVIKALRKLGVICAMVGDGANDCPAIKAADLGISFAETDAAISAPFSSMSPSISCVEKIIMEGKCTTQNSIEALRYYATTGLYKYVACSILIFAQSWYSEAQLTFMSYALGTIIFNFFFGLTKPIKKISIYNPNDNLVSWHFIISFFVHVIIGSSGFIIIYLILVKNYYILQYLQQNHQSWYFAPHQSISVRSLANTALLSYANLLNLTSLTAMYFASPFKEPIYKNILLILTMIGKFIWVIVIILRPQSAMANLQFVYYQSWFSAVILGVTVVIFIIQYIVERLFQKNWLQIMLEDYREKGF